MRVLVYGTNRVYHCSGRELCYGCTNCIWPASSVAKSNKQANIERRPAGQTQREVKPAVENKGRGRKSNNERHGVRSKEKRTAKGTRSSDIYKTERDGESKRWGEDNQEKDDVGPMPSAASVDVHLVFNNATCCPNIKNNDQATNVQSCGLSQSRSKSSVSG